MRTGARTPIGRQFGPYVVERHLKRGGMGDVFAARGPDGGRVALKLLDEASDAARERFTRECQIATRVVHEHVVKTFASGEAEGVAWMAMELLDGADLEARLAAGRPDPRLVIRVGAQVCAALGAAHVCRVIHRDLKPGNIFLVGDVGDVKVLDFGIARWQGEPELTAAGSLLGTVSYMAPEQARGERDLDARVDLWGLGAVLYECLAGRPPFVAATLPGVLYQIISAAPLDLRAARPDLPEAICRVVMRALEKPREARYPTSAAFLEALLAAVPRAWTASSVDFGGATMAAPPTIRGDAATGELRLVSVVYLRGVRDHALVGELARTFAGRVVPLCGDDMLTVFGAEVWFGDEPRRAARFARAARIVARATSVATGRAARTAGGVAGEAVDAAVSAANGDGFFIDRSTAEVARGAGDGGAATAPPAPYVTPFVGRELELSMLVQAVDDAAAQRQPVAVVLTGLEGIGKSRLLHEAKARVADRAGVSVVAIQCEPYQRDTPFGALIASLESGRSPELAALFGAPTERADPQAAIDQARGVFLSLLAALAAPGAAVVAIDDGQWLDASSLAVLRGLGDAAVELPVALWVFARPEGRDSFRAMCPSESAREIPPLSRPQSIALLDAIVGAHPDALLERAGGHPLFLEQLGGLFARGGTDEEASPLPLSVRGAALAQLDRLAPSERECARLAAVFGATAWVEAIVALGGDGDGLTALRRAGVLVARPRSRLGGCTELAFRNQVVREVAYELTPAARLAELHGAAAAWLGGREGCGPQELAVHWSLANERERAASAWAAAASLAARVGDAGSVRAHAAAALAHTEAAPTRWQALIALDDVLQLGSDREAQRRGLEELEGLAWALGPAQRAEVAWRRCFAARVGGEPQLAEAQGASAIHLASACGEAATCAAALIEMALLRADQGRMTDATTHAREAFDQARQTGRPWLVARAEATLGYVYAEAGELEDARAALESAAEGFRRAGDARRAAVIGVNAVAVLTRIGRLALAEAAAVTALDVATRVGNHPSAAIAAHNLGLVKRLRGELDAAAQLQARARREAGSLKHARLLSAVETELGYLALQRPAPPPDAEELAARVLRAGEAAGGPSLRAAAIAVAARLVQVAGGDAVTHLPLLRDLASQTRDMTRVEALVAIATLAPGDGAEDAVLRAVDDALAHVPEVDRAVARTACARRVVADFIARPPSSTGTQFG